MSLPKDRLFGIDYHPVTQAQTLDLIMERVEQQRFTQHVVINVAKMVHMQADQQLHESVHGCDLINVDGMGVVWGARLLGQPVPERVSGVDLFSALLARATTENKSVFLLGAEAEVVAKVADVVQRDNPGLKLAGYHHGYFFNNEEGNNEQAVVDQIRESGAQLLFVAITSPRKENFINRWQDQLGVDFVMGVGGTFDVVAGKVKRAPLWMQNAGLEWFFRILQEPGRMWKRYAVTNGKFAWMLLRGGLSGKFKREGYVQAQE
ncbi:MAG: N-acetylglucosaminyldiphosphoundecaprenol N-acetyl-beta-D-mannosaminyltransferase [Motiliproteus sp.]